MLNRKLRLLFLGVILALPAGRAAAEEPAPALSPLLVDAVGAPIRDRAGWEVRRAELRRQWQEVIGPFPERVPLRTEVLSTERLSDHTRILLRYQTDVAHTNEAYLLLPLEPAPAGARRPGMVVLHATTANTILAPVGLADRETMHMALHLVRRGYVCIAPKNFLWTFEGKNLEQATAALLAEGTWKTGMAKMTWDAIRAVDVLLERAEVDSARLGCIGHSLGGKEALYLAAFDERIRAAISCEGGIGLSFSNWDAPWYLGPQIHSPAFTLDHHQLLALVAPRAFLLIGGESADGARSEPYIEAARLIWNLYGASERLELKHHQHGHDFYSPGLDRDGAYGTLDHLTE